MKCTHVWSLIVLEILAGAALKKVSSYMFIDNQTIKNAKQTHSNCSKFSSLECMQFSLPITSDWVVAAVISIQKYDKIVEVLCVYL